MDHVWALNAQSTPPTLPTSLEIGYPTDTSVGTTPGAWWYHMVTEEIRNTILAGGLTPIGGVLTQLSAAVVAIAQSAVGVANRLPVRVIDTVGVPLTGLQTVDSVTLVNGDRVLRNVGTATTNGIWIVNSAGAWTQPADYSNGSIILEGAMYEVTEGSINTITVWALHSVAGENVTVGTTASQFVNITSTVTASVNAVNNNLSNFETTVATTYAPINNPIINGKLTAGVVLASGLPTLGQFNAVGGSGTAWYNTMLRNDGTSCFLLQSAVQASETLANTATWSTARPFAWSLTTGAVTIDGTGLGTVFGGSIVASGNVSANSGTLYLNSANSAYIQTTPNYGLLYHPATDGTINNDDHTFVNAAGTGTMFLTSTGTLTTASTITSGWNFIGPGSGFSVGNTTGLTSGGSIQVFDATHGNGGLNFLYNGASVATINSFGLDAGTVVVTNSLTVPNVSAGDNSTHAANTAYVATALEGYFPAGTRMPFAQAAAPTGWVQDTSDSATNRMMVIVSDSTGNTAGGSNSPILNNVVPSHTHSFTSGIESIGHNHNITDPGHSHYYSATNSMVYMDEPGYGIGQGGFADGQNVEEANGTQPSVTNISLSTETTNHTHSGTTDNGSSQTNWTPRYLTMIICTKS